MRGFARRAPALALSAIAAVLVAPSAHAAETQFGLASQGAIKMRVRESGFIRVTQPALLAAGLDPAVDPASLRVFADGVEQAVVFRGNADAFFSSDEAIEFYGQGRDTLWTDARTYWLVAAGTGMRVATLPPATTPGAAAPAAFAHVASVVQHLHYLAAVTNGDATNFFGAGVSPVAATQTVAVTHLDTAQLSEALLRVSLQGVTATAHRVNVSLNGTLLGGCTFANQQPITCAYAAPGIIEGANQVTLQSSGGSADFSAVERLELAYPHSYLADDDALLLIAPATATRVTIGGFSAADVRVLDVTDPIRPLELSVAVTTVGGVSAARVDTPQRAQPRQLYAFADRRVVAPDAVAADAPSAWFQSHEGELVILSHARFFPALEPLVARRRQEGWSVQVVDLQDVYDEFGAGDKTVFAIRDFLQFARTHWRVPPRFALLVGDATFDPRNFLGRGDFDFAPTKLVDTTAMETASDDWLADFDGDGVPELAVGRLPVRTLDEATAVVAKTLAYSGTADLGRGGLFVADANEPELDFQGATTDSAAAVASLMPVDRFTRGASGDTPDVLLSKLNSGPFLVNYLGHGSVEVWDGLLSSTQAAGLTNAHLSVYVVMNCLNGFFHDLYTTSLAESLLKAPQGGAVAVWASSTLAEFAPQPAFNKAFLEHLTRTSLGETAMAAKRSITDLEARTTWILFGDPTLFGHPQALVGPEPDGGAGGDGDDGGTGGATAATADDGGSDAGLMADARDGGTADATMDAGPPPATDDANMPADAGAPDAGAGAHEVADVGCGCTLGNRSPGGAAGPLLLMLGALVLQRRRRRRAGRRRRCRWPLMLTVALAGFGWSATATAACGDGTKDGAEACDDGNITSGDGCSSSCTVETGYTCSGTMPSVCSGLFDYYKVITVDRTKVGTSTGPTTLTNYPVLVSLTDTSLCTLANGGRVRNASGYDIIFQGNATACGLTVGCTFSHEVESYSGSATCKLVAWVNVPVLNTQKAASDTQIRVLIGNRTIAASTERVNATWNSNFTAVWHLGQNPSGTAPQMTDSTSNGNNGTSTSLTQTTGQVGNGVSTNGTSSFMAFDSGTSLNLASSGGFTYSGWINTADGFGAIISLRNTSDPNPVMDLMVGYAGGSTNTSGKLVALVRDSTGGTYGELSSSGTINNSAWHYVAVSRTTSTITLFLDGASLGTTSAAASGGALTTNIRALGTERYWVQVNNSSAGNRFLAATFDEFRASNTARDINWVTTDYNNQSSPTTFISFTAGSGGEVATNTSTEVKVLSFTAATAAQSCQGTVLDWQVGFTGDTLGFNVYRQEGEGAERTPLNPTILLASSGIDTYRFVDTGARSAGRSYWLEDVDFGLDSHWYGPVSATGGTVCGDIEAPPGPTSGPTLGPPGVMAAGASGKGGDARGCAIAGAPVAVSLWSVLTALGLTGFLVRLARRGRRARR